VAVSSGIINKGFMASGVKRRRLKAASYGDANIIEKPEAGQANGGEQRNQQQGIHGKRDKKKAAENAGLRQCQQCSKG